MINKDSEKLLRNLHKKLKEKDFESQEDIEKFINSFMIENQKMNNIIGDSDEEQAQELVYEAMESEPSAAKKLLKKAIKLDPNNPDIYNTLGNLEPLPKQSLKHFQKAYTVAKKQLGEDFIEENRGYFWGVIETRPYMRALNGKAESYYQLKNYDKAIDIFEEMLDLNPADNQGIRYRLAPLYIMTERYDNYKKLYTVYEDDIGVSWLYNYALFLFKTKGDTPKARKALKEAVKANKYVPDYLLRRREIKEFPGFYTFGSEDEAIVCCFEILQVWDDTGGAINWLEDYIDKK